MFMRSKQYPKPEGTLGFVSEESRDEHTEVRSRISEVGLKGKRVR